MSQGFSAIYQNIDLQEDYSYPTDKPYSLQPEILDDGSKYGTAIYVCDENKSTCSFDVTPQVIIPSMALRKIIVSKSVYFGSKFNALNKVEPTTTIVNLNNLSFVLEHEYQNA